ncbi:MAG TPA: proline iminopeptidase-family hydrolase [Candidatus Dormibacteraeota bacterium]|nr:proline iminopeptidase-family hydrolase [Candidatus Dormibacteraeota bacterium]
MIEVTGGRVWYQRMGEGDRIPLLVLHGGPGFTHEYVRSLGDLSPERPVVFYDQLGCGRSERPPDLSLWTVERSVEELAQVRRTLHLDEVHLLGQSWGTMLASQYLLGRTEGVRSVIMASPCISSPRWAADAARLLGGLDAATRDVIAHHEASGFTSCPEYQAAILAYYRRHVCRLDPWPEEVERSFAGAGMDVYETMWGPSEWAVTGRLHDFDTSGRLGEIHLPALFTCGRHDEATPETVEYYRSRMPGARLVVFEESAHMAHLEERGRYNRVVADFMNEVEAG